MAICKLTYRRQKLAILLFLVLTPSILIMFSAYFHLKIVIFSFSHILMRVLIYDQQKSFIRFIFVCRKIEFHARQQL